MNNRYGLGDLNYQGLSTDAKPEAPPYSNFLELDTGKVYVYKDGGTIYSRLIPEDEWIFIDLGYRTGYLYWSDIPTLTEPTIYLSINDDTYYCFYYEDMDGAYYFPRGTTAEDAPAALVWDSASHKWVISITEKQDTNVVITTTTNGWEEI